MPMTSPEPIVPHQVPAPQPVYMVRPPMSGAAVAALVASLIGITIGLCSFGVVSAIAVLLGHVALRETRNDAMRGRGMAVASLIMGYLVAGPMAFWGVVVLVTWIVDKVF